MEEAEGGPQWLRIQLMSVLNHCIVIAVTEINEYKKRDIKNTAVNYIKVNVN